MAFETIITATGQAKLVNAAATQTAVELAEMAVGDGGGAGITPQTGATALVNEVFRSSLASVAIDAQNANWLVATMPIAAATGGFTIREVGIFDSDGDLFAYGSFPETYKPLLDEGSSRDLTIRVIMEVSETAAVTLELNPNVVLASQEDVIQQITTHAAGTDHPDATTATRGFVELATTVEAQNGVDASRALTPAAALAQISQEIRRQTRFKSHFMRS